MAKIQACYQLCPFMDSIDQKGVWGVSDDCVNGYVIATLGKNIVIRYRISDQKQVNSWSTTVKLSAPVVYDKTSKCYVGVFNTHHIQLWTESDVDLRKMKKYKFRSSIHCVLSNSKIETSIVVFKNGRVACLAEALKNRKSLIYGDPSNSSEGGDTIEPGDVIEAAHLVSLEGNLIVALITNNSSTQESKLHIRPVKDGLFLPFSMVCNQRPGAQLMGCTFMNSDNTVQLLTVWSDGSLYTQELPCSTFDSFKSEYPGHRLMKIKAVSTDLKVAILPLSSFHIALYGSDPEEEGAKLVIVNIRHLLTQCKYCFKLYCPFPRLWSAGTGNLLLIVGNFLAVAHYHLVTQQLATLIGTQTENIRKPLSVDWSNEKYGDHVREILDNVEIDFTLLSTPDELEKKIQKLTEEGLSESVICEKLFPGVLDKGNAELLLTLYSSIKDIPVEYYFKTLNLCLSDTKNKKWKTLMSKVFSRSVQNDNASLDILQKEFNLSTVIDLIRILIEHLLAKPCCLEIIGWATFVLDAFCQQFLIAKDDSVIDVLKDLKNVVDNQIINMKVWQELIPLINMVNAKKVEQRSKLNTPFGSLYEVEEILLL